MVKTFTRAILTVLSPIRSCSREAKDHAKPYVAPAAVAVPAAAQGQKRIVAVTACPTGVAHTFMAAEAIETEAKNAAGG